MSKTKDLKVEDFLLTEKQLWGLIEDANWTSDGDYRRIGKKYANLSKGHFIQLEEFHRQKLNKLYKFFYDAWLGNDGGEGIDASDDGFGDILNECIGRGKKFYKKVDKEKLQKMARKFDYTESFSYCFHDGCKEHGLWGL